MNKNHKKTLVQRICERLDIPAETFGKQSYTETVGNRELSVFGCEGIHTYTENTVILFLCDGVITVSGEALILDSFSNGRVRIRGVVSGIRYHETEVANGG